MRIYVKTSNHPSAHTLAIDHSTFLDIQDQYWPIDADDIAGDPYWQFKLSLRDACEEDLGPHQTPRAYTFTVTRSRDNNCALIEKIKEHEDDEMFYADHEIEQIPDNLARHTMRRVGDRVNHTIRIATQLDGEQSSSFLLELEELLKKYSSQTVNTPAVSEEVLEAAVEHLQNAE